MKNEADLDYDGIQMLYLLESFRNNAHEVRGIKKLFLLNTLLKYPVILRGIIKDTFNEEIKFEKNLSNNVEMEAIDQKKHINLDRFFIILARLVSKSLVRIINQDAFKQVKLTDEGSILLSQLDEYEWYDVKVTSLIIKKLFGDKSANQLESIFNQKITILSGESY